MSAARRAFEVAAAKGKWAAAFANLNTLNMEEMLASLAGLPDTTRKALISRRFAFRFGLGMPRMEYAWTVVMTRKLPLVAPGDLLQTGQVDTAARFLKTSAPGPTRPRIKLKLAVFTDAIVTNRTLFGELRQKADDILTSQGGSFELDVAVHPTDIPLQEEVYLSTQLEEMIDKAKAVTTIPADRLIVLNVRAKSNVNIHGMAPKISGQRIVVIDTDSPNPDRATLLHEIGHCAGLPHAGEVPVGKPMPVDVGGPDNVMAETSSGMPRKALTVTQGDALAGASFAAGL